MPMPNHHSVLSAACLSVLAAAQAEARPADSVIEIG